MKQLRLFPGFLCSLLIRILAAVLAGALLLSAVRMLPSAPMDRNLEKSAPVFAAEGIYPSLFDWCTSQLDSTTDALILLISACDTGESPVVQAMTGTYNTLSGAESPSNDLAVHYGSGIPFDGSTPYYQYWHGYQLIIRPLLSLMSYQNIRLLNGFVQLALLLVLCILFRKADLGWCTLPYLLSVAMVMPVVLANSLQYSSCYYILTLGAMAVLWKRHSLDRDDAFLFLYIGIATAYFDFLTYPVATLGIPAVVYFCVRATASIRDAFCRGVRICFSWGIGYIGMWSGKWLVGSILLRKNILTLASDKLVERSSAGTASDSSILLDMYAGVSANIKAFIRTPATFLLLAYLVLLFVLLIPAYKKQTHPIANAVKTVFPFIILACMPVIWYMVTANHSTIHHWFTNKALMVSVFAAAAALGKLRENT